MTRTLVTGAAGFTGRYLTSLLAGQGHAVHGVVHFIPDEPIADAAAVHVADLADHKAISRVVDEVRPQHVVHLAGIAFVGHDDIEEMYRANVVGTRQLLEALALLEGPPKSVVIASSANVYGNAREGVLEENLPLAPANDYGVSKVAAEYLSQIYVARLPLIVVRPFNYTGRGQSDSFLIPKIVDHARQRAPIIELGNVDVARDFSDVRAVVETYARLLDAPGAIGGTFNICSGRAVSIADILDLVRDLTGHQFEVRVNPALVRCDEVRTLSGCAAKLEGVIGKLGHIPLQETLRWMLED
ncbi:MAG: NAD-dependent epimerase/dehydratase family protein [Sphingomonas sp.]|nr:NAD-dependent epimerase/dehydratase family protein [Sphingomonas sp.]